MLVATMGDVDRLVEDTKKTQESIRDMLMFIHDQNVQGYTAAQKAAYEMLLNSHTDQMVKTSIESVLENENGC